MVFSKILLATRSDILVKSIWSHKEKNSISKIKEFIFEILKKENKDFINASYILDKNPLLLKFDGIEESIQARDALNGSKWKSVVWDINEFLRNHSKNGHETIKIEDVRKEIRDYLDDYGLNLE